MTAIITMLIVIGTIQLYGLAIMLGMSKTVNSISYDVSSLVDTYLEDKKSYHKDENSYHGEVKYGKKRN